MHGLLCLAHLPDLRLDLAQHHHERRCNIARKPDLWAILVGRLDLWSRSPGHRAHLPDQQTRSEGHLGLPHLYDHEEEHGKPCCIAIPEGRLSPVPLRIPGRDGSAWQWFLSPESKAGSGHDMFHNQLGVFMALPVVIRHLHEFTRRLVARMAC